MPRHIIVSRKGFDSACGGVASPIFPSGAMLSLPIPHHGSPHTYDQLSYDGATLGPLVEHLTRNRVAGSSGAHLDPDLRPDSVRRAPEWRPVFGQCATAQTHLARSGVGPGDLFLFFGWFRAVERQRDRWRFVHGAPDLHVFFGWLQIDEILAVGATPAPARPWLVEHPHFHGSYGSNNTVYVARRHLEIGGTLLALPGGGVTPRFCDQLCLTQPGAVRRTEWRLPAWCFPRDGIAPLTYHQRPERWRRTAGGVALASAARGQEFVLDTARYPEALPWARDLLLDSASAV